MIKNTPKIAKAGHELNVNNSAKNWHMLNERKILPDLYYLHRFNLFISK